MSTGEIVLDGHNVAEIQELGISLMAVEDKIIVMHDDYKSGYECKTCKAKGYLEGCGFCADTGKDRFDQPCKNCKGEGKNLKITCPDCKGKQVWLEIPQTAKSLPTTGVVLSMGPETPAMKKTKEILDYQNSDLVIPQNIIDKAKKELNEIPIRLGTRVIFGPHVGTMIPFKGNIKLKIMRVHEPLAVMFGKDAAARDFIDYETEQY